MSDIDHEFSAALQDRYRIERELGRGGMATVYLAHDLRHGRPVAIKALPRHALTAHGTRRFLDEIRITSRLSHPHILTVHDSGEAAERLYYVMPLLERLRDLSDEPHRLRRREASLAPQQVTPWAASCTSA